MSWASVTHCQGAAVRTKEKVVYRSARCSGTDVLTCEEQHLKSSLEM